MSLLSLLTPTSIGYAATVLVGGALTATVRRRTASRQPVSIDAASVGVPDFGQPQGPVVSRGPAITRRPRTGRLPLPRQVTDLTPADEPSLGAVNEFADRLAELPVGAWLDVGRSMLAGSPSTTRRATPFAILEATINDRGLAVAAWYVRDAIETSAYYATCSVPRWTSMERRVFAAAHAAAEEAALALLAREYLSRADFDALYSPFEALAASQASRGATMAG
jgi:hypothetical protein